MKFSMITIILQMMSKIYLILMGNFLAVYLLGGRIIYLGSKIR
jgi:hypothetical protein